MSSAESSLQSGFQQRPHDVTALTVTPFDLGPGNIGDIGVVPGINPADVRAAMTDPRFMQIWNRVFGCFDGRTSTDGDQPGPGARAHIAGGMTLASTVGDIMNPKMPDHTIDESRLIASNASQIREAGITDLVHGHDHGHRHNLAGCVANFRKLEVLGYMGLNVNIVAPRVWAASEASGLVTLSDNVITPEDATRVIVTGAARARRKGNFTSPEHAVEVAARHGTAYEEKTGPHLEAGTAITLGDEVFDTRMFARHHGDANGDTAQLFGASFGIFAKEAYKLAIDRGYSPHTAALKVMGAIAFTIGTLKIIGSPQLGSSMVSR